MTPNIEEKPTFLNCNDKLEAYPTIKRTVARGRRDRRWEFQKQKHGMRKRNREMPERLLDADYMKTGRFGGNCFVKANISGWVAGAGLSEAKERVDSSNADSPPQFRIIRTIEGWTPDLS